MGTKLFLVRKKIFRTSICSLSDPKSTKDTQSTKDKFGTHFEGTEVSGMFCTCPSHTKEHSTEPDSRARDPTKAGQSGAPSLREKQATKLWIKAQTTLILTH